MYFIKHTVIKSMADPGIAGGGYDAADASKATAKSNARI